MEFLKRHAIKALRGAERYTKTDMVYVAENGFWLSIKTIFAALIALSLSVAFANLLPVHVFGEYKYILTVLGVLSLTTLPGLGTSVVKSIAKGMDGTPLYVLRTKIMWGMLGALGSAVLALYYYSQGNLNLAGAFGVATLFLPFVDTLSIFSTILSGKKLFRVSIGYEVAVQIVSAVAIATALWFSDSLIVILAAYFVSYTAARYVALKMVLARYTENRVVDYTAVPYGIHLSIMEVLGTVVEAVNSLLLWQFLGAPALAMYAFSKALPTQMAGGLKKLALISLPKFVTRDMASIKETLVQKLLFLWVGLIALVVVYILAAPYIFHTLFPQYTDAIFYTQLYALSLLFFPKKIIGTVFNAHSRTGALYANAALTPLTQLVLSLALVPSFGILGALSAELAAQFFSLVLVAVLLIRTKS